MNRNTRIKTDYNKKVLLRTVFYLGLFVTLLSASGPNPLLCVPSFVALYIIIKLLFFSKYMIAFMVAMIYQWAQVSVKVIYGTFTFTPLEKLTRYSTHIVEAYLLSCLAIIVVSVGMYLVLRKIHLNDSVIKDRIRKLNFINTLFIYLGVSVVALVMTNIQALYQFAVIIASLKWGIFYILFLYGFQEKKYKWILFLIVLYEFGIGCLGYFSDWKNVLFYLFIGYLSAFRLTPRRIAVGAMGLVAVLFFGLVWTSIKTDYRSFLGEGTNQVVKVSRSQAAGELFRLLGDLNLGEKTQIEFLDRMSYIDYFSACLSYVPAKTPHENGKLTSNAFTNVLKPRVIFPEKEMIDESTHLTKYTGKKFSNLKMGVSFSLGYVGDLYVDYGYVGMFIALFLTGCFIGIIFRNIYRYAHDPVYGIALLVMVFMLIFKFEISLIKLVGNLVIFWIVARGTELSFISKPTLGLMYSQS